MNSCMQSKRRWILTEWATELLLVLMLLACVIIMVARLGCEQSPRREAQPSPSPELTINDCARGGSAGNRMQIGRAHV